MADVLVLVGFRLIFFVFMENSFAASAARVEMHQPVIGTGSYRYKRHPMYAGAALLFLATPIALGSFWALPITCGLVGMIAIRLLKGEKYLAKNLRGYNAYRQQVQSRLIPYVW